MNTHQPLIYIILLNWNGKQDTLACLASIANITYPNFRTVIVDNGSSDDSISAIQTKFPSAFCIATGENLGYAGGNNVGIRFALSQGADAVCLLNNDTVVDKEFLSAFVMQMHRDPKIGILGAKIYLFENPMQIDHLGGRWNPKKAHFDLVAHRLLDDGISWETTEDIDYVCGAALFVKKKVFDDIGLLEPNFFLIWEEADFCFRAAKQGHLVQTCPRAKLWHKVSASFTGGKRHTTYFWWRGRLLWIYRNCPKIERYKLYLRVLLPEIFHIKKLYWIKICQLLLLRLFRPTFPLTSKKERLLQYKAALAGITDFRKRKFGKGPNWIYQRPPSR